MKKTWAAALSTLLALLAPGTASYVHAGQASRTRGVPGFPAAPRPAPSADLIAPAFVRAAPSLVAAPVSGATGVLESAAGVARAHVPAAAPKAASSYGVGPRAAQSARAIDQARLAGPAAEGPGAAGPRAEAAGALAFDGAASGKAILLVGTNASRPFILSETKRVAEKLGLKVYLLDKPQARAASKDVVPDSDFIPAPIDDHSEAAVARITAQVAEFAKDRPIEAVLSFLNPYVILAGELVDRLGAKGNSAEAVKTAHTKSAAREAMNRVPEIATPYRLVASAEEARAFYREVGGKVVMKPEQGVGSQGVITDIASEAEAAVAFEGLRGQLEAFAKRPDAGFFSLDQIPGIMMESQLSFGPEVDVELVMQGGEAKFAEVSDNAPMDRPLAVEKNSTFRSQLPRPIQARLIEAAVLAVRALGLKDGNMHVELIMTPEGPRLLEVNARMGGVFVFQAIKDLTGLSLVEQGWRAVLGMPVEAAREPGATIEARFLIPQVTGRIEAMEGLEALKEREGFLSLTLLKSPGDEVQAAPDSTFDYLGYLSFSGRSYDEAMGRMMAALESVKVRIRRADGSLVEQTGAYTHSPVDAVALLAPEQRNGRKVGFFSRLMEALRKLPPSFKSYVWGISLLAMALEGITIITSVYGIARFGLLAGILSQAVNLIFRIPGGLAGAKWVDRFDAKKIYVVTTTVQGLLFLSLPFAAWLLGPASGLFLAHYFFVQIVQGLIYGATRGMAESQIMPKLVGQDRKMLETAGFLLMVGLEAFSLVTALGLSPFVRATLGADIALGVFAAIMLASVALFRKIRLVDEPAQAAQEAEAPERGKPLSDSLPWREYIPYVAASFMHFTFYALFTGVFATYTFNDQFMSDFATGYYDLGSLAIGLVASVPALLASLAPVPAAGGPQKRGVLDRLSPKTWFGIAALIAGGYLVTSLLGLPAVGVATALGLGGIVTVNRMKWMSSYLSRLKKERHARVIAVLNSVGIAASLLPFIAISVGKILGVEIMPLLIGVVAAVSAAMAAAYLLSKNPSDAAKP